MILTQEIIEKAKSLNGGWNFNQIRALGYDPKKKWKKYAMGRDFPEEKIKAFINLRTPDNKFKNTSDKVHSKMEYVDPNMPWSDQYLHPNWQRMRLMVLKRDGFKCVNCRSTNKNLHVHHIKYLKGKMIWDVPIWYLVSLCDDCHSEEHGRSLKIKKG